MKSPLYKSAVLGVLLIAIAIFGADCSKKKVTPPPAASKTEPAKLLALIFAPKGATLTTQVKGEGA